MFIIDNSLVSTKDEFAKLLELCERKDLVFKQQRSPGPLVEYFCLNFKIYKKDCLSIMNRDPDFSYSPGLLVEWFILSYSYYTNTANLFKFEDFCGLGEVLYLSNSSNRFRSFLLKENSYNVFIFHQRLICI